MKKVPPLFFILVAAIGIQAQGNKLDSLKASIQNAPQDTAFVKNLLALTEEYGNLRQFDSSLSVSNRSLLLSQKLNYKPGIAASYEMIAFSFRNSGQYADALKNYLDALKTYEETGNKDGQATN